ncbi:hypothetical protein BG006_008011, partial [Podila minutissima]
DFITVSKLPSELCKNIWLRCPKLLTIDLVGAPSRHTAMSSQKEDTQVMLIESVHHLQSFTLDAESMTPRICQVLLDLHCSWLEKIDLTIHQPRAEDFSIANKILATGVPNLMSFAMSALFYLESWQLLDCLAMFSRPWTCIWLMKVQVCGFAPTAMPVGMRVPGGKVAEAISTEGVPNVGADHFLATYGWVSVHVPYDSEANFGATDLKMPLGAFLEQSGTCPAICEITLNSFVCKGLHVE